MSRKRTAAKIEILKAGNAYLSIREEEKVPLITTTSRDPSVSLLPKDVDVTTPKVFVFITGAASLNKAKFTASLSGLLLDFEMRQLNASYFKNRQTTLAVDRMNGEFTMIFLL